MATTVWRGHLAFGLVSFPVRLFRAARAEKVSLRRLYRPATAEAEPEPAPEAEPEPEPEPEPEIAFSPRSVPARPTTAETPRAAAAAEVKFTPPVPTPVFQTHNKVTTDAAEKPVAASELVKGFEFEKGQYVVLEEEELKSITPQTSKEMQIVEFVRLSEIDPIFLETSYYLTPEGPGERPYTLLLEALRQSGYVGVAQLAMHRREHVVIIRPGPSGMIVHTMFYPDEVRQSQEYRPETSSLAPRELDLAKRLIEAMVVPFEPGKFRDSYRERLNEMIASKVDGQRIAREPAPRKAAAVIDIMQALQESLKQAKKPPKSAPARASGAKAAGSSRRV